MQAKSRVRSLRLIIAHKPSGGLTCIPRAKILIAPCRFSDLICIMHTRGKSLPYPIWVSKNLVDAV